MNLILSKPISRAEYALGKLAGFMVLIAVMVFLLTAVVEALTIFYAEFPRPASFFYEWLVTSSGIFLKSMTLVAVSAFFAAAFTTPILAYVATLTTYLVGIGASDIIAWARFAKLDFMVYVGQVLSWLAPQYSDYDFIGWVLYGVNMNGVFVSSALIYFGGYVVIAALFLVLTIEATELE